MKQALILCAILLLAVPSYAETIEAASCSYAHIEAALTAASDGDTVTVPAGSCEWKDGIDEPLTIPAGKNITLQGAGIGLTKIYMDAGCGNITLGKTATRITGFEFTDMNIQFAGDGWRIDHNKSQENYCLDAIIRYDAGYSTSYHTPSGLIDNNQFFNNRVVINGGAILNHVDWTLPDTLGTDNGAENVVYIEDNVFTRTDGGAGNCVDGNYGGQHVFRYNHIVNESGYYNMQAHSIQTTYNRAFKKFEFYGNINEVVAGNDVSAWIPFFLRGGSGPVFLNYTPGNWTDNHVGFDIVRGGLSIGGNGLKCNGMSQWDGNYTEDSGTAATGSGEGVMVSGNESEGWDAGEYAGCYIYNETEGGAGVCQAEITGASDGYNIGHGELGPSCSGDGVFGDEEEWIISCGYPCRDQIGRGHDATLWDDKSPTEYTQASFPMYIFGNRNGSNGEVTANERGSELSMEYHLKENRDYYEYDSGFDGASGVGMGTLAARPATCTTGTAYWASAQDYTTITDYVGNDPTTEIDGTLYKCTDTDTWTAIFTPYTYPHPLRGDGDITDPVVAITSPTSDATYNTSSDSINVGGTASDAGGLASVTWESNKGGSGSATGTTTWSITGITLVNGENVITVTAWDASGNYSTDTLTVTYTPEAPAGGAKLILRKGD